MGNDNKAQIAGIFEQLRVLRESIAELEDNETSQVSSLRGHQTVDVEGAVHLSFMTLQKAIAKIEETLAAMAEATGEIPKL